MSVDVRNTGARQGDETVQLYVSDLVSSMTRPLQELRGFQKIRLVPGQRKTVRFRLGPDELSLLDQNLRRVVEPGDFEVLVGSSARDIRVRGKPSVANKP